MVITSENKKQSAQQYIGTHFRYALINIIITFCVLLFLNIYSSGASQQLFYKSKETAMIEKCYLAASEISNLEVLNTSTATSSIAQMGSLRVSRLIITDQYGISIYDSMSTDSTVSTFVLLPEVATALQGSTYDVFSWSYHDGVMQSRAAAPIFSNGKLIGCVYMMENDSEQGMLIRSLQQNIFFITLILEAIVILFSIVFTTAFSKRLRRLLASMRIIRDGDYSHKVVVTGMDELTLLSAEFNDLTDKLQISENKRRRFVSDASHELKTPLASIKLLSDSILQNDMDMDTVREFVEDIGNEAERLNRMSQKLLSLTHIESQEDGDCEIIYIWPTVERVVRMLKGIAQNSNISIELQFVEDSTILMLEGDLYQIIFNLVENGIKYNVPGGKLTVSLLREGDNAVLKFTDTGVGIPPEAMTHLFERFYRVDKARSRNSGGSGLGLAIVRNMVERNQGTISAESSVGSGSTFTVTFPNFDTEEDPQ